MISNLANVQCADDIGEQNEEIKCELTLSFTRDITNTSLNPALGRWKSGKAIQMSH